LQLPKQKCGGITNAYQLTIMTLHMKHNRSVVNSRQFVLCLTIKVDHKDISKVRLTMAPIIRAILDDAKLHEPRNKVLLAET